MVNRVPVAFRKLFQKCVVNLRSLSDTMDTGTPCSWKIFLMSNRQNSSSVKVIHKATKCAYFVSRSTITHTTSCLRSVCGKCVTKSIVTCSHFHSATSYAEVVLLASNAHVNLLKCETSSNKVPYVSLHPAPVVLATKITLQLRATWMYNKSGTVELLEDLLSQISQLRNHYPSFILKTTICVDGPAFVTCTRLYPVPDEHYLYVLSLRLNHSI